MVNVNEMYDICIDLKVDKLPNFPQKIEENMICITCKMDKYVVFKQTYDGPTVYFITY